MVRKLLSNLKFHFLDVKDPDRNVMKICIRTTLACLIVIALFQWLGFPKLSSWAGFAAFSVLLNDNPKLSPLWRFIRLVTIIALFTVIVWLGMLLSHEYKLFLLSVLMLAFIFGFLSCLGVLYFTVGGWLLFLFVLAGSAPIESSVSVVYTFLLSGLISLFVAFLVFPINPKRQVIQSIRLVINKLIAQVESSSHKLDLQLDQSILLLDQNIRSFLQSSKIKNEKQFALIRLAKTLEQLNLMVKSVSLYILDSEESKLCRVAIVKALQQLINQLIERETVNFSIYTEQLNQFRIYLTELRKAEIKKQRPSFESVLMQSNYLYHFIKIIELCYTVSEEITVYQGKN